MPSVELSEKNISLRGNEIQHLLRILSRVPQGPAYRRIGGSDTITFGVHEGAPSLSGFREWRFATSFRGFWANYYEVWTSMHGEEKKYYLSKAYLTIYKKSGIQSMAEQEFICLHCDPNETDDSENGIAIYKKGPHLHIKVAQEPIPKAHLALARGHLDSVLSNATTLTEAFEWCIQMIKDEILSRVQISD